MKNKCRVNFSFKFDIGALENVTAKFDFIHSDG